MHYALRSVLNSTLALVLVWSRLDSVQGQTSVGLTTAVEFSSRTVGAVIDDVDPVIDQLRDRTSMVVLAGVGVIAERRFSPNFSVSTQVAYRQAGFQYEYSTTATLNPLTGQNDASLTSGEFRLTHHFLSFAIDASETWGQGTLKFYAEEYLVPIAYLASTGRVDAPALAESGDARRLDNANGFHLAVRGGVGGQFDIASNLRLRVGVTAHYHFTQTFDDAEITEHLYGFGPAVSLLRVFGAAGTPEGPADDIYY